MTSPLQLTASRGWRELRESGDVVVTGEEIVLTSAAAVEFSAKRPGIILLRQGI